MKTSFKIIPVILCLSMVFGLNSCDKKTDDNPSKGKIKISLSISEDLSTLKSAKSGESISDSTMYSYQLILSVADANGVYIFEDMLIPLYGFGDGFVSEQVEIKAGDFFLKKFMVLNNYGQVILASPLENSPRAYLVEQPLPLFFQVNPNETTLLAPEVLPVDGYAPADFGYASFMVQVVKPLTFYVMAVLDNPLLMRPTLITDADLYVYTNLGWFHSFKMEPLVNMLEVRASDYYEMVAIKEGFPEVRIYISASELRNTSKENPYIISFGQTIPLNSMVLQPGPEDGMDAWVTNLEPNKNFGDYKYFETSFLPEPILTVMRSTQSLISFDLGNLPKSATIESAILTLYYETPLFWERDTMLYPNPDGTMPPMYSAVLQQIIEPWDEYKVSWNNLPKTTEVNQVMIYPFVKNANVINVDVSSIFVQNPYTDNIPFPNFGMLLKESPEDSFPGFRFVSSDYPEEYMRPKLTIKYSLPVYGLDK